MASVTVSRAGDRLIAVKQVSGERAGDIEREAGILRQIDHPGVVRFVDTVETPDRGRALHTEFVSSDTWATRPINDPAERAAAMAALASVIADLHDRGIAHCRLNPSHVLHGEDDRPVLCGLRAASEASPENRSKDLVALAELCHDPTLEPGPLAGKLSALGDAIRAGRLSARELSRRIGLLQNKRPAPAGPAGAVGDSGGSGGGRRAKRSGRRSLVVVAVVVGASAAVLAAGIWSRGGQMTSTPVTVTDGTSPLTATSGGQARESVVPGAGQVSGILGPGVEAEARLAGPTAGSAMNSTAGGSLLPPTPGAQNREVPDGLAGHEPGAVLEHGGNTYAVGSPGDFVETGDWDCDGEPTPAIIRPSTGDVVLFDAWPAPHQSISMPVRWQVEAPTGAEAVAHGSCHLLRVYTSAGSKLFDPMADQ